MSYAPFVNRHAGSVHTGFGVMELSPSGSTEVTAHAFEKGIYVIEGTLDVLRDGLPYRLSAGDYTLIPTATPHALRNGGNKKVSCVVVESPQPKSPEGWQDTWFYGEPVWPKKIEAPDLKDPRLMGIGHYNVNNQPPSSAVNSYLYGFSMKMLLDSEVGATHFRMFIINFRDGGLCDHHDHPFEETYFMLDGEIDCVFEGKKYTLKAGDYGWTGVGSQHGFFPKEGQPARWLEVQVPQPPRMGGQRWYSQWDYINQILKI